METSRRGNRRGSALVTVMGVIMAMSLVLALCFGSSMQRSYTARQRADRARALSYAEAGASQAYAMLCTNWTARDSDAAFPKTSFGMGSYDVQVTAVDDDKAVIWCTGVCRRVSVPVALDVRLYSSSTPGVTPGGPAFDYAMVCGGEFKFRGCGSISGTNGQVRLHANGEMSVKGNAQANVHLTSCKEIEIDNNTVDGDVTAPKLDIHKQATITGTVSKKAVDMVEIPDIDLTPYYRWAAANGEVKNGFHMEGGTYTPKGGVLWVNGDVHLTSHYVFNGSIVATGIIRLSGSGDVTATTFGFSAATRDGPYISNQSSGTITGLIYVKYGDYLHTANGCVVGQIIVQNDIDKAGNSDVVLWNKYIPIPPASPSMGDGQLAVIAWQK